MSKGGDSFAPEDIAEGDLKTLVTHYGLKLEISALRDYLFEQRALFINLSNVLTTLPTSRKSKRKYSKISGHLDKIAETIEEMHSNELIALRKNLGHFEYLANTDSLRGASDTLFWLSRRSTSHKGISAHPARRTLCRALREFHKQHGSRKRGARREHFIRDAIIAAKMLPGKTPQELDDIVASHLK